MLLAGRPTWPTEYLRSSCGYPRHAGVTYRVERIPPIAPLEEFSQATSSDIPCGKRDPRGCRRTRLAEQRDNLPDGEAPEQRAVGLLNTVGKTFMEPEMLLRFSSLHRLLRITFWCLRWRHRITTPRTPRTVDATHILEAHELDAALILWIRVTQSHHYGTEVSLLSRGRTLSSRSSFIKLSPFMDTSGVMRVGGRLKNAILAFDERHPMIVPPESWMAQLLVDFCLRTLHGGVQLTLGLLRQRFWLPRGRTIVKGRIHRCITCTRWRAATPRPLMGDLSRNSWMTPARAFQRTGVDYAGPIFIRTTKGRGHKAHKGFIAVFVCLGTRAAHLEAVLDYTTEAFLATFRRFVSRRDLCQEVLSNCGTNFIGACRELRQLFSAASADGRRIAQAVASDGIRWKFNPPAAPHFGGLWETAVKFIKHHLRRVIGETTLTFEEMATLLTQVEACLNS